MLYNLVTWVGSPIGRPLTEQGLVGHVQIKVHVEIHGAWLSHIG